MQALLAAAAGALAFLVVVGARVLDASNIAWLAEGDSATHYLGWQFFRSAPWAFPPGANPGYGLELASSIVYSDSIPGLALAFKPLDALLPGTFQYFGAWLLACFILQAVLGWKLMTLASERAAVRLLGAGLIAFSPPFLWRLGVQSALAAHWLVLGALYLNLRPHDGRRLLWWALLLCAAALVHAYLFVMAAALWAADYVARSRRPMEPLFLGGLALSCLWLCGTFVLAPDAGALPYGLFRMNLLSPLDPSGWSHVLPDIPEGPYDYDGFNFLGLGVLLLALAVLPKIRAGAPPRRRWPLLAVLIALALYALSHKIAIAATDVIIPLPERVVRVLSIFPSSGRFFWPVYYALVVALIGLAARSFGHRAAVGLLSLALVVQVTDTSAAWWPKRDRLQATGKQWPSALNAPFWEAAAAKYSKLRWVPAANHSPHWRELAYYAAQHRMGTDAVYLARVDRAQIAASRSRAAQAMRSGELDEDTLYVLDPAYAGAASWEQRRAGDVLVRVDGFTVLAPGWVQSSSWMPTPTAAAAQR